MCRLLGSVARVPVTVDEVLGDGREAFLELSRKHGDGWGHAFSDGGPLRVRKAPDAARISADFADLTATQASVAALTHLRWATMGLQVGPANTHPFTDGRIAFAHNGSIDPPAALNPLIAPTYAARRAGDTDSERLFLALLSRLADHDEADALVRLAADVVAAPVNVKSLNCMLLTPTALYCLCCYDPSSDEDPDYYPLQHRSDGDAVVVTSTGWVRGDGWQRLENGQLLVVDRASLSTSVRAAVVPPVRARASR